MATQIIGNLVRALGMDESNNALVIRSGAYCYSRPPLGDNKPHRPKSHAVGSGCGSSAKTAGTDRTEPLPAS
ncbi:uncharacterized protein BDV17DRAFT_273568 [Aspergillus undulatus]|uniref:uncharacterized protein n=1 Tax=Aspergillus undulatus TaxID=1810928 RepID=UPI003CCE3BA9